MTRWIIAALVTLPVASFAQAPAQIEKGTFELGGGTELSYSTGTAKYDYDAPGATEMEVDHSETNVDATAIYYLAPNVGVGFGVSYDKETAEFEGDEETTSTLLIGPGISAQLPIAPQAAIFGRGMIGYASGKSTATGESDREASGYGLALQAGIKYFVVKQASLDFGLGYQLVKMTFDSQVTASGTIPELDSTTSGIGLSLGLSVYFGG